MRQQPYSNKTVLTGVKPTGSPHLGNLVGAIRPIVDMSATAKTCFVFIADIHALNAVTSPADLVRSTHEIAATFLALGLDPTRATLFRQSDVPEVYQVATLLQNVTPKGLMNRAHAYKAAVDANIERGLDPDAGINIGLFNYPILMAADILTYGADLVPVGKDQKQHIEIARDIAKSFNNIYGADELTPPEPFIQEETQTMLGLDGRKMSKSYGNYIPVFADRATLKKIVMRIVTDSTPPDQPKDPDTSTIVNIYRAFASPDKTEEMRRRYRAGEIGYGEAKQLLFEVLDGALAPLRDRFNALMNNTHEIDAILEEGARKARAVSRERHDRIFRRMFGRQYKSF